jgi:hypothetical protein
VIPRERLLPQKWKEMRKRSKRSWNAKNKKEDAYLKLLSKRSRSS